MAASRWSYSRDSDILLPARQKTDSRQKHDDTKKHFDPAGNLLIGRHGPTLVRFTPKAGSGSAIDLFHRSLKLIRS